MQLLTAQQLNYLISSAHPSKRGVSQEKATTSTSPYSHVSPQVPPLHPGALRNWFHQTSWEGRLRKAVAWQTTRPRSTESGESQGPGAQGYHLALPTRQAPGPPGIDWGRDKNAEHHKGTSFPSPVLRICPGSRGMAQLSKALSGEQPRGEHYPQSSVNFPSFRHALKGTA